MSDIKKNRTLHSKTFDLGGGKRRLISRANPVHYLKEGAFENINTDLENGGVHRCGYDVDILVGAIGYEGTAPDGKAIRLELDEPYVEPVITGNKVIWPEVSKDTDLQIIFLPSMIRVNRILKTKNAKKSCKYKVKREAGIKGKLLNLGSDDEGKKTKLSVVETPTGGADEVEYEQTWSGEVAVMNTDTRKKEWSADVEDVKYPITIDPTEAFDVNADGIIKSIPTLTSIPPNNYDTSLGMLHWTTTEKAYPWLRFTGIIIPIGSVINEAHLLCHTIGSYYVPQNIKINAFDSNTPGSPTGTGTVTTPPPGTPQQEKILNVTGMIGDQATLYTNNTDVSFPTTAVSPAQFKPKDVTITDMVQSLVTKYDYVSGVMLFATAPVQASASPALRARVYMDNLGPTRDAQLTVDYTAAGNPDDKTVFHHG